MNPAARATRATEVVLCFLMRESRDGAQEVLLGLKKTGFGIGRIVTLGGHVEPGESIVDSVVREMKEETGLSVWNLRLCGVKQFPIDGGRYLVFFFNISVCHFYLSFFI